jgi:AcrR family transcriptional regulator
MTTESAAAHGARMKILTAAARALATHGYHGMSMRDLARATGRSPASFYNYFDSKEALLFSVQCEAFSSLRAANEKALAEVEDPRSRLYVFVLNHVRTFAAHPDVMRVLVHEAAALPPKKRAAVRQHKEAYFEVLRQIVEDLVRETRGGRVDPLDVERSTYCVFGMLNWIYGWYERARHGDTDELARTIHRIALAGIGAPCPERAQLKRLEKHLDRCGAGPLLEGRLDGGKQS